MEKVSKLSPLKWGELPEKKMCVHVADHSKEIAAKFWQENYKNFNVTAKLLRRLGAKK